MEDNGFYTSFSEEELAADECFQKWVLMPDEESDQFWSTFIRTHPNKKISVENARKLVQHLTKSGFHIPFLTLSEKQALKADIFDTISRSVPTSALPENTIPEKKRLSKWWLAAAGVLILAAAVFMSRFSSRLAVEHATMLTTNTLPKQIKEVHLPDGSIIILNGNSSVRYQEQFNENNREIYLDGNAYFKVAHKEGKSFVVHTPEMAITVTGTEFNVNSRNQVSQLVLTEGSVEVGLEKEGPGSIRKMTAGEKMEYDLANRQLVVDKAETSLYAMAWDKKEWHFNNTTMATVAELIEQFYGTEVVFENSKARNLTITAVVSVEDFTNLIKVIEKTLMLSISEKPGRLFVK